MYKGAALPSGNFTLSANTNIAGATATPSVATLSPAADSDNNVNVNVNVPAGTTPGTYNVFLIATLSTDNTQTRGGLVPATLTVGEAFGFSPAPALPSLGTVTLNGQAQTKNATMSNFGVIDSPGSSDVGWNVTAVGDSSGGKSPVFKQYWPHRRRLRGRSAGLCLQRLHAAGELPESQLVQWQLVRRHGHNAVLPVQLRRLPH